MILMKGLVEDLSSRVTLNLCVGPAPKTEQDIMYIVTELNCMSILNVSNEPSFMIESRTKQKNYTEEQFLEKLRKSGIPRKIDIGNPGNNLFLFNPKIVIPVPIIIAIAVKIITSILFV